MTLVLKKQKTMCKIIERLEACSGDTFKNNKVWK